jgi:hypothetical protein
MASPKFMRQGTVQGTPTGALLCFLMCLASGATGVFAQDDFAAVRKLQIELRTADDELPTQVCVAHEAVYVPDRFRSKPAPTPIQARVAEMITGRITECGTQQEDANIRLARQVRSCLVRGLEANGSTTTKRDSKGVDLATCGAVASCGEPSNLDPVGVDLAACGAGGNITGHTPDPGFRFVTCSSLSPRNERYRLLTLAFRAEVDDSSVQGTVQDVRLDGNLITIRGRWATHRPDIVVADFGHYLKGDSAVADDNDRAQLIVRAKCLRRSLRLPQADSLGPEAKNATTVRVKPIACPHHSSTTCAQRQMESSRSVDILAPRGRHDEARLSGESIDRTTVILSTGSNHPVFSTDNDPEQLSTVRARWNVDLRDGLPDRLAPQLELIRFWWSVRREFHLPHDPSEPEALPCPRARLVEPDVDCQANRASDTGPGADARCGYVCAKRGARFELPVTVAFDIDKQQEVWRERLSSIDQVLSGYADNESRHFFVYVGDWNVSRVDANATPIWAPNGLAQTDFPNDDVCRRSHGRKVKELMLSPPTGGEYRITLCPQSDDAE